MKSPPKNLTAVDLFCGAGGLSLGLRKAGFKVLAAVDHHQDAVDTYRRNLGDHVQLGEIVEDQLLPRSTIIAGGPPCQGFSSAGLRRTGDHRNTLVTVFAQIVARLKPTAFLFENVEGFLTGEGGARVIDLLEPLVAAGYRIHMRKLNAANYGVPQHRKRVIAVGGLGWSPTLPVPTRMAFGAPGADLVARGKPRAPTLLDALDGLPNPTVEPPGSPQGHFNPPHSEVDAKRIHALKPGQRMRDLPENLRHDSYSRRANRRVMDGTPTERRGGAPSGIRRLKGDEPSKAITGAARNEFLHPTKDRFLTIRECARVQTFPDDFEFCGSQATQATLIGNAVPVAFAAAVAKHLAAELRALKADYAKQPGALLSFVPTESTGMSPALQTITQKVTSLFGLEVERKEQMKLWV